MLWESPTTFNNVNLNLFYKMEPILDTAKVAKNLRQHRKSALEENLYYHPAKGTQQ